MFWRVHAGSVLDYSSNDIILNRYFLQTCESGLGGEVGEYQTSRFLCESQPGRCIEGQSYPIGRPSCLRSFSFLEW